MAMEPAEFATRLREFLGVFYAIQKPKHGVATINLWHRKVQELLDRSAELPPSLRHIRVPLEELRRMLDLSHLQLSENVDPKQDREFAGGYLPRVVQRFFEPLWRTTVELDVWLPDTSVSQSAAPSSGGKPVDEVAKTIKRVAIMLGEDGGKIMAIVNRSSFTTEQKLRALGALDERFKGYKSDDLAQMLGVSPASIRNSDAWREWNPKPAKRAKSATKVAHE